MKKVGLLIILLLFLIFPKQAEAGVVYPIIATNVTFNTSTKVLSFRITDNPLGYILTASAAVAIYDDSGGHYFAYTRPQFQNLSSTCNNYRCTVALDQDWDNLQHFTNDTIVNLIIYTVDARSWWSQGIQLGSILDAIYINHPPILSQIEDKTVNEGQLLQFALTATDTDGDKLTYSAANLPTGATFDTQTATFSWTPSFNQNGYYPNIEFTVADDGSPIEFDDEIISITVGDINGAPEIDPINPQVILENELLTFSVNAKDPDGDSIGLSAENLPTDSSLDAQTGAFSWTPTLNQSGIYIVKFITTDTGVPNQTGSIDVALTVADNPTKAEQADILASTVLGYNLDKNIENSFMANIKTVKIFIENGKDQPAINQLNVFIAKVDKSYSKGEISQIIHDNLTSLAQNLISDLQ